MQTHHLLHVGERREGHPHPAKYPPHHPGSDFLMTVERPARPLSVRLGSRFRDIMNKRTETQPETLAHFRHIVNDQTGMLKHILVVMLSPLIHPCHLRDLREDDLHDARLLHQPQPNRWFLRSKDLQELFRYPFL
jgi:hypothetical protein